ncbi:hypothetical protein RKLH11_1606 [Rhodobacteraceae bacterium KLH11]|nr:hypothetical protein RKLH11_1606 [Rhodobacteraceae bacterium KLH11]
MRPASSISGQRLQYRKGYQRGRVCALWTSRRFELLSPSDTGTG